MAGMMSISGIASGIKADDIVAKVMEYARRPQQQLQAQKEKAKYQLGAWQEINTRVLALKMKADAISSSSSFKAKSVTSSDETIAKASASADAMAGSYDIRIIRTAQSHQRSSASVNSAESDIGTGTLDITFANDHSKDFTVEIDSANNTLIGLRDAINRADKGVTASIVNTGTPTAPAYQLLLTSKNTGEINQFTAVSTGLAVDFGSLVQTGSDAEIEIGGSGAGAVPISMRKASNTITDVIPGVTINLISADPAKTVNIQVQANTADIKSSIQDFVNTFNGIAEAIDKQSIYDADTGETGTLFGNFQLQRLQSDLMAMVTSSVSGLTGKYSALSSIGITLGTSGRLNIDDSKLSQSLSERPVDVARLFAADVRSESTYVSYASSTSSTKISGPNGWAVEITQAARRAQATAGVALDDGTLTSDETIVINGKQINLTTGMSLSSIITEINKYANDTNVMAFKDTRDGHDYLALRSRQYGSGYDFTAYSLSSNQQGGLVTSGLGTVQISAANAGGQNGLGTGLAGLDVEGTIAGEVCKGKGQILSADSANTTSPIYGLSLLITATNAMSTSIIFSKGVGSSLSDMLGQATSGRGSIVTAQDSLNLEIEQIDKNIADMETRLLAQQDRLLNQFNQMEVQLAKLQSQGQYLAAQLSSLTSKQ